MSDEPTNPTPDGFAAWRWPIAFVLIAALGLVAFVTLIRTPERLIESAGRGAAERSSLSASISRARATRS